VLAVKATVLWVSVIYAAAGFAKRQSQIHHDSATMAKWQALVPKIESLFAPSSACPVEELHIEIVDAAEFHVPGGLSVALVDWCRGGAYTNWIIAMHIEDGKPAVSRFTNAHDRVEPVGFLQGASEMHGADVKLAPEKNAIYGIQWDKDQKLHLSCDANAYVWNQKTKAFKLDSALSKHAARTHCPKQ
jgi:hypothetical protein